MANPQRWLLRARLIACLGAAFLAGLFARQAHPEPEPVPRHDHVERVAAKIEDIGGKQFDELVADMDDLWVTRSSGVVLTGTVRGLDFPWTLANRNTRRLLAELRGYPAEKRRELCRKIFEQKFSRHRRIYEERLANLKNPSPRPPAEACQSHLAVCNALFLTADGCEIAELAGQLRKLMHLRAEVAERLKSIDGAPPGVYKLMARSACPDDEFVMSVLLYNISAVLPADPDVAKRIQELVADALESRQIRRRQVELVEWNAEVDWYDLARFKGGFGLDRSKGVLAHCDDVFWGNCRSRDRFMADLMASIP